MASSHQVVIDTYAEALRKGLHSRETRFTFNGQDVSAEVFETAGPETDTERELRAAAWERNFPTRLGGAIAGELSEYLFGQYRGLHLLGEKFELGGDDDDDPDELILVRKCDGKQYRIEIDAYAEEL